MAQVREKFKTAIAMNRLLMESDEFVVGDIETTSLSPAKGGKIIEVAGVKVKNGRLGDRFQQLIDPQQKIYQKIIELTNITNEMLHGMPVYAEVLPDFKTFIGDAVFVAHNAMFDWDRFLIPYFEKLGIKATNDVVCTKHLAKMYYPELEKHGLGVLMEHMKIPMDSHHRALSDSECLAKALIQWKRELAPQFYDGGKAILIPDVKEIEQADLFSFVDGQSIKQESQPQQHPSQHPNHQSTVSTPDEYRIKRVSYWEPEKNNSQRKMQRIYVMMPMGSVYFDIPTKHWYNKDVKKAIDFDEVHRRVLSHLKLKSTEELLDFRNAK